MPVAYNISAGPTSVSLTANGGFDGSGDINLLAGTDSLAVGSTAMVSFTVQFSLNGSPGPFNNSGVAFGQSPGGTTTDLSTDGTDPDSNGDGNPGGSGEGIPTLIGLPAVAIPTLGQTVLWFLIALMGMIGIRKSLGILLDSHRQRRNISTDT